MRCFVAAFLTADSATRLRDVYQAAARSRERPQGLEPVPRDNYHVTLKFIGEVPQSRLPELLETVAGLEGRPLSATVLRVVALPRPDRPRLLAAELAPHPELAGWRTLLEQRLGAEGRSFRPHVTVARTRGDLRRRRAGLAPWPVDPVLEVELLAPALYRSDRTPEGARYRQVTAVEVSGRCGP